MVNSERIMVHAWSWMQNTSVPWRKWRQQQLPMLWPGKCLVLQLIYEKIFFSHSQNEMPKELRDNGTDLELCAFPFLGRLCGFLWETRSSNQMPLQEQKAGTCLSGSACNHPWLLPPAPRAVQGSPWTSAAAFFYTHHFLLATEDCMLYMELNQECALDQKSREGKNQSEWKCVQV